MIHSPSVHHHLTLKKPSFLSITKINARHAINHVFQSGVLKL